MNIINYWSGFVPNTGISDVTALEFIAEVGVDMSKWQSAKHFAAWLNLAANTIITADKSKM